jgi:hypothetical protein
MDPTLQAVYNNAAGILMSQAAAFAARQNDTALVDQRAVTAYLLNQAAAAGTPATAAADNTASHVPVNQPYMAPGYVAAPQPTAATPGAKS